MIHVIMITQPGKHFSAYKLELTASTEELTVIKGCAEEIDFAYDYR